VKVVHSGGVRYNFNHILTPATRNVLNYVVIKKVIYWCGKQARNILLYWGQNMSKEILEAIPSSFSSDSEEVYFQYKKEDK